MRQATLIQLRELFRRSLEPRNYFSIGKVKNLMTKSN